MEAQVDLDAYFARIGYDGPRAPSLAVLRALQARHPMAIPFENLDVLLGAGVKIDLASVERKLVAGRRGGYCFEHNTLFAAVLRALGFSVTPLAARVRWQVPAEVTTPRTHMILRVDLDGAAWLVDVGFGGSTPTAPLRLDEAGSQPTPHETFRLTRDGDVRALELQTADGWADVYRFTLEPQHPIDYELANWYTSAHPSSLFLPALLVARAGADGTRLALRDRELTVRRGADTVERRTLATPDELLDVLADRFGLELPPGTRFGAPGAPWPR